MMKASSATFSKTRSSTFTATSSPAPHGCGDDGGSRESRPGPKKKKKTIVLSEREKNLKTCRHCTDERREPDERGM